MKHQRFLLVFTAGVLISATLFSFTPLAEASEMYDGVIRLHVIANSDSDEDQALKLCVRDRILSELADMTDTFTDTDAAFKEIERELDTVEAAAVDTLRANGFDYCVNAFLNIEHYPTREYEGLTLPSGDYKSLRVIIGSGKGQNWWCILYPPLCRGSARADEQLAETGFTANQVRLITDNESGEYRVRFKAAELFSDIKQKLKKLFGN